MECFVCGNEMKSYFDKKFNMSCLQQCEYVKCEFCGMVISKTHFEMDNQQWKVLNHEYHVGYQGENFDNADDPNWILRLQKQSEAIAALYHNGILQESFNAVDYGCGDGKLADMVNKRMKSANWLKKYDKYMHTTESRQYMDDKEMVSGEFDLVVSCSVFEHLLGSDDLDNIIGLVKNDKGVLAMHTLVCEEVPCDSAWFYLLPVHCSFYSNKAMSLIFKKYGFKGCFYHVEGRMWFFFYDFKMIQQLNDIADKLPGTWISAETFVEYWKTKPYRKGIEKE